MMSGNCLYCSLPDVYISNVSITATFPEYSVNSYCVQTYTIGYITTLICTRFGSFGYMRRVTCTHLFSSVNIFINTCTHLIMNGRSILTNNNGFLIIKILSRIILLKEYIQPRKNKKARINGLNSSGRTELKTPFGYISNYCLPSYIFINSVSNFSQRYYNFSQ